MQPLCVLASFLGPVLAHYPFPYFEVRSPAEVEGQYDAVPYDFSTPIYHVDATLNVAVSCPCDWLTSGDSPSADPGSALLVVDGLCSGGCLPISVWCAAALANFSALTVSSRFNLDLIPGEADLAWLLPAGATLTTPR